MHQRKPLHRHTQQLRVAARQGLQRHAADTVTHQHYRPADRGDHRGQAVGEGFQRLFAALWAGRAAQPRQIPCHHSEAISLPVLVVLPHRSIQPPAVSEHQSRGAGRADRLDLQLGAVRAGDSSTVAIALGVRRLPIAGQQHQHQGAAQKHQRAQPQRGPELPILSPEIVLPLPAEDHGGGQQGERQGSGQPAGKEGQGSNHAPANRDRGTGS